MYQSSAGLMSLYRISHSRQTITTIARAFHDDTDWVDAYDGVHPLYDIGSGYGVRV